MTHAQEVISRLTSLGIAPNDAVALRRISMTLQRWHEMECGDAAGNAVERDETTGKPYRTYERASGSRGGSHDAM